ncbi:Lrp/AsnC family transcriptional regulator [Candidatus Woesearchaeota archaeon]|nr:Lrp/AsnC family transcriptional regulator [Candidatus Woesearchaeota archaeon]
MLSEKDATIISHLRNNARKKITAIAAQTKIPVTTIYDKVRVHERKYVKKHTTLLDFPKLGYLTMAHVAVSVPREQREVVQKFLEEKPNVNSLFRTNMGHDFLAECVFKNPAELQHMVDHLEGFYRANSVKVFSIIEELKKEEFLTKPEHLEAM